MQNCKYLERSTTRSVRTVQFHISRSSLDILVAEVEDRHVNKSVKEPAVQLEFYILYFSACQF